MNKTQRCDGVTRRDLIRIGGLSALGLGLGDFFRLQNAYALEATLVAKAKSCILIWLDGGPSHLETFDPKPDATEEVRGPLETIATNVDGVRVGECLEQTAQVMDNLIASPTAKGAFKLSDEPVSVRLRPWVSVFRCPHSAELISEF